MKKTHGHIHLEHNHSYIIDVKFFWLIDRVIIVCTSALFLILIKFWLYVCIYGNVPMQLDIRATTTVPKKIYMVNCSKIKQVQNSGIVLAPKGTYFIWAWDAIFCNAVPQLKILFTARLLCLTRRIMNGSKCVKVSVAISADKVLHLDWAGQIQPVYKHHQAARKTKITHTMQAQLGWASSGVCWQITSETFYSPRSGSITNVLQSYTTFNDAVPVVTAVCNYGDMFQFKRRLGPTFGEAWHSSEDVTKACICWDALEVLTEPRMGSNFQQTTTLILHRAITLW